LHFLIIKGIITPPLGSNATETAIDLSKACREGDWAKQYPASQQKFAGPYQNRRVPCLPYLPKRKKKLPSARK
jgi:hypothetical protein